VQTVILCGGKGTRLGSWGERVPKPLLPVGEHPILWHIMKIYAAYEHSDFVLCLGHLAAKFEEFARSPAASDWNITLLETGLDTPTGGRVKKVESSIDGDDFFVTYGDGVADIDLTALLDYHRSHGRIATVTSARPQSAFGIMHIAEDGRVTAFDEKPIMSDWVNGGFFVIRREVFRYLEPDSVLERAPLERLAAEGELMAYRHHGFWTCMDTYKDNLYLNECWESGQARWKIWQGA